MTSNEAVIPPTVETLTAGGPERSAESQHVADKLDDLRQEHELGGRDVLVQRLADALRTGRRASHFANVDLVALVGPDSVRADIVRKGGWLLTRLGTVLGFTSALAMFAPIALTWYHLRDAMGAYREFAAGMSGTADQSFLALWADGFAGRSVPLGDVAMQVLTVLVVTAVVVAFERVWVERRDRQAEDLSAIVGEKLRALIGEAQLLLVDDAVASPKEFADELAGVVSELRDVGRAAHEASGSTRHLIEEAGRATGELRGLVEQVATDHRASINATESLAGAVRSLITITEDLIKANDATNVHLDNNAKATLEVSERLHDATTSLGQSIGGAADRTLDLIAAVADLEVRRAEYFEALHRAQDSAAATLANVSGLPSVIEDGLSRIEQGLGGQATQFEVVSTSFAAAGQAVAGSLAATGDRVAASVTSTGEQLAGVYNDAGRALVEASAHLGSRLAGMADLGTTTAGLSVTVNELTRSARAQQEAASLLAEAARGFGKPGRGVGTPKRRFGRRRPEHHPVSDAA
jgi:hypothetical protein